MAERELTPRITPSEFAWTEPTPTPVHPPPLPPLQAQISVFGANKFLAARDWAPVSRQNEIGLLTTVGRASWPVHLATDLTYSARSGIADGVRVRSATVEAALGARRALGGTFVLPEFGGGTVLTLVRNAAEFSDDDQSVSGIGLGFWLSVGTSMKVGESAALGAHLRYSTARATVGHRSLDTGGFHAGITVGTTFGSRAP